MIRCKNEAANIERVIRSILPLCAHVFVLDDHSEDGTAELANAFDEVTVYDSQFEGLDERRDYAHLLGIVRTRAAWGDYVLHIDGDEELEPGGQEKIRSLLNRFSPRDAYALRILDLWNSTRTIRVDGVYAERFRASLFCLIEGKDKFGITAMPGNLHCLHVPAALANATYTDIALRHWGYITPEIRARKFEHYSRVDPGNAQEDYYRHITQGDDGGAPADAKLLHAGPLRLITI
jgi:glycosyltransferase involved in cell wall biosynthesis